MDDNRSVRTFEVQALEPRLYLSAATLHQQAPQHISGAVGHALHMSATAQHAAKKVLGQAGRTHGSQGSGHTAHPRPNGSGKPVETHVHAPVKPPHNALQPKPKPTTKPTSVHAPQAAPKPKPKPTVRPHASGSPSTSSAAQSLATAAAATPAASPAAAALPAASPAPLPSPTMQVGSIAIPSITDPLYSIAVQKDGKLVVLGAHSGTFSILRYTTLGNLDSIFGTSGAAAASFSPGSDTAHAIAIDYTGSATTNPNYGKIVVAGSSTNGFAIARFNPDGTPDLKFGTSGKVAGVLASGSANGIVIGPDGTILVGGLDAAGKSVVVRLNSQGLQDKTFGTNGVYGGALKDYNSSQPSTATTAASGTSTTTSSATPTRAKRHRLMRRDNCSSCGSCCGSCNSCSYSAPNISFDNGGSGYSAVEACGFSATGSIYDPNPNGSLNGTVNYGDGTGDQALSIDSNGTFTLSHTYAEEAHDTIYISVTDTNDSQVGGGSAPITINDAPPSTVSINASSSTIAGTTFTGTGSFSDIDYSEGGTSYSASVNYGDGSGTQSLTLSGNSYTLNHVYWQTTPQGSPDTITVTVNKSENGQGTNASGQFQVNVTPVNVASPTLTQQGFVDTVNLSAGSISGRTISTWTVTWGDGASTSVASTTSQVTHTYSSSPAGLKITASAYDSGSNLLANYTLPNPSLISNFGSTVPGTSDSVIVLDPTASEALFASGNGQMLVGGAVVVDSSSSSALFATGNASLQAGSFGVHGNYTRNGNATITPTPTVGTAVVSDPLGSLTPPTPGTPYTAVKVSNGTQTLSPGAYSSISVTGNGNLVLNPGVYTIQGGGFNVTGNGGVTGSGVAIVNTSDTHGRTGSINFAGNGTWNLTPMSSGSLAGILIFQPRTNSSALTISGNAAGGVFGTIYAPSALVSVTGNGQLSMAVDSDRLRLTGNGKLIDKGIIGGTGYSLTATEGLSTGNITVARFYGVISGGINSDSSALIDWGNGSTSEATISADPNGGYDVVGSTTYAEEGSYTITTSLTPQGAATTSVTSTATVADAAMTAGALTPPTATEGQPFSNATVFHFTDADPAASADDYTAQVTLGDGSSVTLSSTPSANGQIVAHTGGGFDVQLSHTYAEELHNVTFGVTVTDNEGGSGTGTRAVASASTGTFSVVDAALNGSGTNSSPVEGGSTVAVASFTDGDPAGATADYSATINWGDGTATSAGTIVSNGSGGWNVNGTHTYAEDGAYTVHTTITDAGGASLTVTSTATVADAPLTAGALTPPAATEGQAFTNVTVFHFTDADPNATAADYSALITPGYSSSVTVTSTASANGKIVAHSGGGFDVQLSDTFAEEFSNATFSVTVTDNEGGSGAGTRATATASTKPFNVSDASLAATGASIAAAEQANTVVVANFTDSDPSGATNDYLATINWGDGTATSGGVIASNGSGGWKVTGTHTYAEEGTFTVLTTITDSGGASTTVGSTATVTDAPLSGSGANFNAVEAASNATVASFTDADPAGATGDYSATINWGDGSAAGTGTIVSNGSGGWNVNGTHTYPEEGTYTVHATINDTGGASLAVTGTATVADASLTAGALTPPAATEGQTFTNVTVFHFTDADPNATAGDYTASVTLGDGNTVALTSTQSADGRIIANGAGGFDVQLSHTYTVDLTNANFSATVTDNEGGSGAGTRSTASASTSTFSVIDVPVSMQGGFTISAGAGTSFSNTTVATFTDPPGADGLGSYSATINWGDGSATSTGAISYNATSGVFTVQGGHNYSSGGNFTITITAVHGGLNSTATSSALVPVNVPEHYPPFFTSTAPTDAYVGSTYRYDPVTAVSPQASVPLNFSLLSSTVPAGQLTVSTTNSGAGTNTGTGFGLLTWNPTPDEAGNTYSVTLKVTDSAGASATQVFNIAVHQAVGNHPPIIISKPRTAYNGPKTGGAASGNVAPAALALDLANGQSTGKTVSVTLPTGSPAEDLDVFFLVDTTGSMGGLIYSVQNAFSSIANNLVSSLPNANLEFGAAEFKDFEDGGPFSNGIEVDQPLTSNRSAVQTAINGWSAGGGDDTPEQNLAALQNLANNWTADGGRADAQRIIIYVSDTSGWENGAKGFAYPSLQDTINSLQSSHVGVYALDNSSLGSGLDSPGYLPGVNVRDPQNQGSAITSGTGGQIFYNVNFGDTNAVSNTITNAVTTAVNSVNVDVVASDPTVQLANNTGIVSNVAPGGTASFNVTFTGDIASHTFNLEFVRAGTGVVLGSIPVTMDSMYYYPVKAIDPDGDPITYGMTGNTNGATIDQTSGLMTWDPTTPGTYDFTVTASDGRGGEDQQPFQVVVTNGSTSSNALAFAPGAPTTATVGTPFAYQPTVSETKSGGAPSTDPLYFYLLNGPSGALGDMSIDRYSGAVTWTPTQATADQKAEIEVTDGMGASNVLKLDLDVTNPTVGDNGAPVITWNPTPQNLSVPVGSRFDETVTANDPDNDPLAYDLPVHPVGMAIDPSTGELAWLPTPDDVGSHPVVVRVRDGRGGSAYRAYTFSIAAPTYPPLITSIPITPAVVGQLWTYPLRAVDPANQAVTFGFNGSANPSWLTFNSSTNVISGTAPAAIAGQSVTVTVSVADSSGGSVQTFLLPIVAASGSGSPTFVTASLPPATVNAAYETAIQVTDPNGLPLAYSVTSSPAISGLSIDPQTGVLSWNTPAIVGGGSSSTYAITVTAADAVASKQATYSLIVNSSVTANRPPQITSTAPADAAVGTAYVYQAKGFDPDGDAIRWMLDEAPQGMVIDGLTGVVSWIPTEAQNAPQNVIVRLMDARGGHATEPFTIQVHGGVAQPLILSTPPNQAQTGSPYAYPVLAFDPNGLPLTYNVASNPAAPGLSIDRNTGVLTWSNPSNASPSYSITITASDGILSATQAYTLSVANVPINRPPTITSSPLLYADAGATYQWQVTANDPDNNLASQPYSLLEGPSLGQAGGISIDPTSGVISWTSPVQGNDMVTVKVTDAAGAFTTLTYPLTVSGTRPQIVQNAITAAFVDTQYIYNVMVNGGSQPLSFALDSGSTSRGMTIDSHGHVAWTPSAVGSAPVTVTATDAAGISATYTYTLAVSADVTPPTVSVQASQSPAPINQAITLTVAATDPVGILANSLTLTITAPDGTRSTVTLNQQSGAGTYTFAQVGTYTLLASATDLAGIVASNTLALTTYNPAVAPTVSITSPASDPNGTDPLTAPDSIEGSIFDSAGIQSYQLQAIPANGGKPIPIAPAITFAPGATTTLNGVLGTFDPTAVPNGACTIMLTATAVGGATASTSVQVMVNGQFKLGNFALSFTDLSLPLSGIPVTVTRSYDSQNAPTRGDFGYGWTFGYAQAKLQTTDLVSPADQFGSGDYQAFNEGTNVWITLPGGQREKFTFSPTPFDDGNPFQALSGESLYQPAFVAATPGVTDTLTVAKNYYGNAGEDSINLVQAPGSAEFDDAGTSDAYNPASPEFGGVYTLTTKEGIQYDIDANSGKILDVRDRNGDTITYGTGSITNSAPGGSVLGQITINRDSTTNDITSIVAPDHTKVVYTYDNTTGDLIGVAHEDASSAVVSSVTLKYADTTKGYPPHLLTQIVDANNVPLITVNYDTATGRVTSLTSANGQTANLGTTVSAPGNQTAESSSDSLGYSTTNVYDDNGNIVRTIKQKDNPTDPQNATYTITLSEYDGNNNLTAQSLPFDSDYNDIYTQQPAGYPAYSSGNPNLLDPTAVPADWSQINTYDTQGNLLTSKDSTGSTTTNTYDDNGQLLSTTDGVGDTTTNAYDGNGNLTSTADPDGKVTNYLYNAANQLTETDLPVAPDGTRQYTRSQYTNGYVTQIETGYIDVSGNYVAQKVTTNLVDGNGNVTDSHYTWTNPFDPTDVETVDSTITYDASSRVIGTTSNKVTRVSDNTVLFPGTSTTTHYRPDGKIGYTTDSVTGTTAFKYDAAGQTLETDSPDGTVSVSVFDQRGRVILATLPFVPGQASPIQATRTVYDGLGRVIATQRLAGVSVTVTRVDTTGIDDQALYQVTAVSGAGIIPARDASNNIVAGQWTFDPAFTSGWLSQNSMFYNADGTVDHTIDDNGLETDYIYNPGGQQKTATKKGVPVWDPSSGEAVATDLMTTTTYDAAGRTLTTTDAKGYVTAYEYDADGRVTKTTFSDRSFIKDTYDALGDKTGQSRKAAAGTSDANLVWTTWTYNELGQLTAVNEPAVPDPANGNTPTVPVTSYVYDAYGNEVMQVDANQHAAFAAWEAANPGLPPIDYSGSATRFYYDALGRPTGRKLPDVPGQPTTPDAITYDAAGREATETDFKGQVTQFVYDNDPSVPVAERTNLGRLVYKKFYASAAALASGAVGQSVHYTYDSLGRVWTVTDDSGTTTDYYDADGNLIESDTPEGNLHYIYNTLNQLAETWTGAGTDPHQAITATEYGYDSLGRLDDVTALRLNGQDADRETTYAYDAEGNKAHEVLPNGVTTDYTYDTLNRLQTVVQKSSGTTIFSDSYILNDDGTRASDAETERQPDGSTATISMTWGYDADGRLTSESVASSLAGQSYADTFKYDLSGNRVEQDHTGPAGGANQTINSYYDARNELTSQTSSVTGTTSYAYDPNGSQTDDGSHKYVYDLRDKLTGVTDESGNVIAAYVYDDAGNRVQESVASGGTTTTSYYLTDANNPTGYAQPIEQWVSTSGSRTNATLAMSYIIGDRVLAQVDGSANETYLLTDGHGSTRLLTDSAATVTAAFNYDAFGGAIGFNPAVAPTVFLFGGDAVYDPASGLYLHGDGTRAREGFRFIQADPTNGNNQGPLTLHRYLYANANPIMFIDPTGHDGELASLMVGTSIVAGLNGILNAAVGGYLHGPRGAVGGLVNGIVSTYIGYGGIALSPALAPISFAVGGFVGSIAQDYITYGGDYFGTWKPYFSASIAFLIGGVLGWTGGFASYQIAQKLGASVLSRVGMKEIIENAAENLTIKNGIESNVIAESKVYDMVKYAAENPIQTAKAFSADVYESFIEAAKDAVKAMLQTGSIGPITDALADAVVETFKHLVESLNKLKEASDSRIPE